MQESYTNLKNSKMHFKHATAVFILYIQIYSYIYQGKRTALHWAAGGGHDKIVETLVEAKADPCAQDWVSVLKETRLDADRGMR